jgi:hypothetical protein
VKNLGLAERDFEVEVAIIGARVVVDGVAVIALFAGLRDAVATSREGAGVRATVIVDGVAIVAVFPHGRLNDSVATDGHRALVRAAVEVGEVAVVAGLIRVDDAIAARGESHAEARVAREAVRAIRGGDALRNARAASAHEGFGALGVVAARGALLWVARKRPGIVDLFFERA